MRSVSSPDSSVRPYDLFILVITFISLGITVYLLIPTADPQTQRTLIVLDWLFSAIFLVDFFATLFRAPDKWTFMKWGWLDLLGSLPALPGLRLLRLARVIRALRLLHRVGFYDLGRTFLRQRAASTLWLTAMILLTTVTISSLLILRFESSAANANITSGFDAIWWAFVTITTVGYGDHYPISESGRLLAAFLMLIGVGTFSVLTSYLATNFLMPTEQKHDHELVELRRELAEIKQLLRDMNQNQSERAHRV